MARRALSKVTLKDRMMVLLAQRTEALQKASCAPWNSAEHDIWFVRISVINDEIFELATLIDHKCKHGSLDDCWHYPSLSEWPGRVMPMR